MRLIEIRWVNLKKEEKDRCLFEVYLSKLLIALYKRRLFKFGAFYNILIYLQKLAQIKKL